MISHWPIGYWHPAHWTFGHWLEGEPDVEPPVEPGTPARRVATCTQLSALASICIEQEDP